MAMVRENIERRVIRMGFAFNAEETDVANLRGVHIDDKCDRRTAEEIVEKMRGGFLPGERLRFVITEMPVVHEVVLNTDPLKEEA